MLDQLNAWEEVVREYDVKFNIKKYERLRSRMFRAFRAYVWK